MSREISRRSILRKSAVLAGAVAGSRLWTGPFIHAASAGKLRTAVIGANGQGRASVGSAMGEQLVALVDVDDARMADTMKWLGEQKDVAGVDKIRTFFDYREMLDKMHKEIDVVFIATPDHHHAPAAMRAIKYGKHTFCEKPLTHDIHQARALAQAAKENKVMTQMGNQGHSAGGYHRLVEYIGSGAIGNVLETHTWIGMVNGGFGGRPASKPVPKGLHWDEWIGPAPLRDYHDGVHPGNWRSWWQFGGGTVADWGCHQLDGVFWALKLGEAKTCSIELLQQHGGSDERYPIGSAIRWNYPARGGQGPVAVHWYDGKDGADKPMRPAFLAEFEKKYNKQFDQSWGGGGTLYIGDKGVMYTANYGNGPRILPEEAHKAWPAPPQTLTRPKGGHFGDFLRACRDGSPSGADFSYSGPLTEFILTGHLAYKAGLGKKIDYDIEKMQCPTMPELSRLIRPEYRKGWEV